jgi:ribonuclease III
MKDAPADFGLLEKALGHHFSRPELLHQSLTHSSLANETNGDAPSQRSRDNEQLEFLGDAILGFVTSRALFERFPHFTEGQLSKLRAHLVSARHLIKVARHLGLGAYLHLGRGEERSGGRLKSALLVDALEAVIAAIYLDAGLEPARKLILDQVVFPELESIERDPAKAFEVADQKSALQEWLQATGHPQPSYHVVQEEGPDHKKTFTVELRVTVPGLEEPHVSRAQGSTKKKAEQLAAQQALSALKEAK